MAVSEIPFSGFPWDERYIYQSQLQLGATKAPRLWPTTGGCSPQATRGSMGPDGGWWILPGRLAVKNWRHIKMWSHFFLGNSMSSDMLRWVFETVKEGVDCRCLLHVGWRMLKIMLMLFLCFVPHGFLHILHKFFARFLRRERRTKKKCVHSMNGWRSRAYAKHVERCCIHQQDQDRPGTLNNQFFNGCFNRMTPNCYTKKRLFHQTSILNWLFGVPGVGLCTPLKSTSFIKRYQALHMFSGHPYCLEFKIHQIHIWYIRLHLSQKKTTAGYQHV